ncbi:hypothetical protein Arub01_07730 [Actinomadura rubrobrunea]|uniref:Uncharacterized protein n=1 Tax=Actinomadura rubrobrunea TaxID=115335 RepID=A0A9W6PSZ3_9ACTN|nr:hypothetical protein Arub01_07730 [Actinomadura rubrobrunea]
MSKSSVLLIVGPLPDRPTGPVAVRAFLSSLSYFVQPCSLITAHTKNRARRDGAPGSGGLGRECCYNDSRSGRGAP